MVPRNSLRYYHSSFFALGAVKGVELVHRQGSFFLYTSDGDKDAEKSRALHTQKGMSTRTQKKSYITYAKKEWREGLRKKVVHHFTLARRTQKKSRASFTRKRRLSTTTVRKVPLCSSSAAALTRCRENRAPKSDRTPPCELIRSLWHFPYVASPM